IVPDVIIIVRGVRWKLLSDVNAIRPLNNNCWGAAVILYLVDQRYGSVINFDVGVEPISGDWCFQPNTFVKQMRSFQIDECLLGDSSVSLSRFSGPLSGP